MAAEKADCLTSRAIDLQFEGFTIPEGSLLCVSPILGHLDSDIFPDAGIFFPKRFAPPKKKYLLLCLRVVRASVCPPFSCLFAPV